MPAPHRSVFYRPDALPADQPTASKHWRHNIFHTVGDISAHWVKEQFIEVSESELTDKQISWQRSLHSVNCRDDHHRSTTAHQSCGEAFSQLAQLSGGTGVGMRWRTGKDKKVNKIIYPLVLWWQCNNQELQKRRQAQWKANPSCVPVSNKLLSLHRGMHSSIIFKQHQYKPSS